MSTPPLTPQRRFTSAEPGEDLVAIARRCLGDRAEADALRDLQSWNLHLFARRPSGVVLGADVVFLEPPHTAAVA
ncbi:MAG TPA: hypothetical protein VLA56_10905 [Pseudomonadales bacterium]|nr:hypothetical protein [Pseudomonadales bacterium]